MTTLIRRWEEALRASGAAAGSAAAAAGADLLDRWREPHRHHHTVDHLVDMLHVIDAHAGWAGAPDLVRIAAWCHDAVYDPRAAGDANERASAQLAGDLLRRLGVPAGPVAEVRRLVLLTARHDPDPTDRDGALICDADLAILAAAPERYDRYAAAIRREYRHVPAETYRIGRAAVLRHLLALPARYRLPILAQAWEDRARANLERELAVLTGTAGTTETDGTVGAAE